MERRWSWWWCWSFHNLLTSIRIEFELNVVVEEKEQTKNKEATCSNDGTKECYVQYVVAHHGWFSTIGKFYEC